MAVTESLRRIFYQLALVSLLASLIWASTSVYSSLNNPAEIDVSEEILEPFSPTLDLSLMEEIANRERLSENLDLIDLPTNEEESPIPSSTPEIESSPLPASESGSQGGLTP